MAGLEAKVEAKFSLKNYRPNGPIISLNTEVDNRTIRSADFCGEHQVLTEPDISTKLLLLTDTPKHACLTYVAGVYITDDALAIAATHSSPLNNGVVLADLIAPPAAIAMAMAAIVSLSSASIMTAMS